MHLDSVSAQMTSSGVAMEKIAVLVHTHASENRAIELVWRRERYDVEF